MKRPNILIISTDQMRADCLGIEGRRVRTPNLDRLARQGTRFGNAITPAPVCQPARASMLTGQLCRTHGVHDSGIDLDPAVGGRGFAGALRRAGYDTALFGKAHLASFYARHRTGSPECVMSSEDFDPDWHGPYMGFDHVELMLGGHNWFPPPEPPRGQHYERFFHADGRGAQKLALYEAGERTGANQCWHSLLPPRFHNTFWTADRAQSWLRSGRDPDKPFCAWVSFPDPHHPFDCPEPWSRLHDPATVDLPQEGARDLENRPWWHQVAVSGEPIGVAEDVELRKSYSRLPEQTDAQLREIIANVYGQIAFVDDRVGQLMRLLSELELEETTYVFFLSDHGNWLGDHGLILTGPMFYDGLLRVPLIMRGPGIQPGCVVDEPVSTLDLGPTLYDLTGVRQMLDQHGRSLRALAEGRPDPRDFAMSEWDVLASRVGTSLSLRCVRSRTAKLTVDMISGVGEMYDLAQDPHEMRNLFDDPSHAPLRFQLEGYLAQRPDDMTPLGVQVGFA